MIPTPILVGKTKIEIRKRAADRDVADAERVGRESTRFAVQMIQHGGRSRGCARQVGL